MLFGFFDETGLDERSKSFWVAGYVAHTSYWYDFSRLWRRTLKDSGLSCFHMTEFASRQGEFLDMCDEAREALINDLISQITSSELIGVAGGLVRQDYHQEFVDSGIVENASLPFRREWWKHPYVLAFQQCVVEAARGAEHLPASEQINFFHHRQREFQARIATVFREMANDSRWPNHGRLGDISFAAAEDYAGIQAADLLCYELRRRLNDKLTDPSRPIRDALRRLRVSLISSKYVDAENMRAVIRLLEERPHIE